MGILLLIFLLLAIGAVGVQARNARAERRHREDMASRWEWAQGLGPRKKQERRRP
jgi:hypothetical protein